jgi:hypothetical protein
MVMRLAMVMHPITPLLQPHTPLGTGVIHTSNITHMCLIAQPHGDRYSSKQPRSTNQTSSGAGRIARSKRETERFGALAQTDVLSMDQQWWKKRIRTAGRQGSTEAEGGAVERHMIGFQAAYARRGIKLERGGDAPARQHTGNSWLTAALPPSGGC